MPEIVSAEKWKQECDELLIAEKEATRLLDGLAERRRRLPMVAFDNARYEFDTPEGKKPARRIRGTAAARYLSVHGQTDQMHSARAVPTSPTMSWICPSW
jgi:hypothetical protein